MAAVLETEPKLLKAFALFQQQCEQLEQSHRDLRAQLDRANLRLAEKNRELALRITQIEEMKERLSGILESITDAVVLVDAVGTVELANRAADEFFGDDPQRCREVLDHPALGRAADSAGVIRDRELRIQYDGDERCLLVSMIPMAARNGAAATASVVSIKDVTAYRRLQERVAREDRLSALGQVAASVAHEIRNPLAGIEGFARLLEADLRQQPGPGRLATKILYGTRQLNCVVNNLLNYTRDMRGDFYPQDLGGIIREVAETVGPMAEGAGITIDLHLPERPLSGQIDGTMVRQILTNLIVNAIEACPPRRDGRVVIRANDPGAWLTCEVEDNGCGIPRDTQKRIFDPFVTHKKGGVGLGLALSQRMAEEHGGRITVRSEPEHGAIFKLTLRKRQAST